MSNMSVFINFVLMIINLLILFVILERKPFKKKNQDERCELSKEELFMGVHPTYHALPINNDWSSRYIIMVPRLPDVDNAYVEDKILQGVLFMPYATIDAMKSVMKSSSRITLYQFNLSREGSHYHPRWRGYTYLTDTIYEQGWVVAEMWTEDFLYAVEHMDEIKFVNDNIVQNAKSILTQADITKMEMLPISFRQGNYAFLAKNAVIPCLHYKNLMKVEDKFNGQEEPHTDKIICDEEAGYEHVPNIDGSQG